jgi:hypothetical protein
MLEHTSLPVMVRGSRVVAVAPALETTKYFIATRCAANSGDGGFDWRNVLANSIADTELFFAAAC